MSPPLFSGPTGEPYNGGPAGEPHQADTRFRILFDPLEDIHFVEIPDTANGTWTGHSGRFLQYGVDLDCALNVFFIEKPSSSSTEGLGEHRASFLFNIFSSAYLENDGPWTWAEQLLLHEAGHTLGLSHPFVGSSECSQFPDLYCSYDDDCNPENGSIGGGDTVPNCSNNVMSYGIQRDWLSPKQMAFLRRNLSIGRPAKWARYDHNIVLNSIDTTWSGGAFVLRKDLTIPTGSKLTIRFTTSLNLLDGARIIVERGAILEIDGHLFDPPGAPDLRRIATINLFDACSDKTGGIYVLGNNDLPQVFTKNIEELLPDENGILILTDAMQISGGKTAIRIQNPLVTGEEQRDYYGGLIMAENVEFINNRHAVAFMKYEFPN